MSTIIDVERAVSERYGQAAQRRQPELCCPIEYDPQFLSVIPDQIKERDYGCGDPSAFVGEGDVVLDLGSGGGKIDKTFQIYNREPYADDILPIVPYESISPEEAAAFDCRPSALRDPRETKGLDYEVTDCLERTVVNRAATVVD